MQENNGQMKSVNVCESTFPLTLQELDCQVIFIHYNASFCDWVVNCIVYVNKYFLPGCSFQLCSALFHLKRSDRAHV